MSAPIKAALFRTGDYTALHLAGPPEKFSDRLYDSPLPSGSQPPADRQAAADRRLNRLPNDPRTAPEPTADHLPPDRRPTADQPLNRPANRPLNRPQTAPTAEHERLPLASGHAGQAHDKPTRRQAGTKTGSPHNKQTPRRIPPPAQAALFLQTPPVDLRKNPSDDPLWCTSTACSASTS